LAKSDTASRYGAREIAVHEPLTLELQRPFIAK
jgi:hypothetical protein